MAPNILMLYQNKCRSTKPSFLFVKGVYYLEKKLEIFVLFIFLFLVALSSFFQFSWLSLFYIYFWSISWISKLDTCLPLVEIISMGCVRFLDSMYIIAWSVCIGCTIRVCILRVQWPSYFSMKCSKDALIKYCCPILVSKCWLLKCMCGGIKYFCHYWILFVFSSCNFCFLRLVNLELQPKNTRLLLKMHHPIYPSQSCKIIVICKSLILCFLVCVLSLSVFPVLYFCPDWNLVVQLVP